MGMAGTLTDDGVPVAPAGSARWRWRSVATRVLLAPRLDPSFGRIEALALLAYTAALAGTIPFHEPWADEAQAWLIAKNSSLWDIFYRRLHYEGTPGLWHLILWIAIHLHLPYAAMNWISGAIAVGGTYILLRYSPFPLLPRLLLPFTFWLQYQYAVVARSYCIVPLLTFSVCAVFCSKSKRPLLFALCAGLLANVSLYSLLWAGAITVLYVWTLWRDKRPNGSATLLKPTLLLCGLFLFAFYTALPASDLIPRHDGASALARPSRFKDRIIPVTPAPADWQQVLPDPQSKFPPEQDESRYTRGNVLQRAMMRLLYPKNTSYRVQTWGHRLQRAILPIESLFYSISASNLVAASFLLSLVLWLTVRHSLRFALPLIPLCILGAMTWMNDHHAGLLFVALISAIWLAWQTPQASRRGASRILPAFALLFVTILLEQVWWSTHAVASDIRQPYDPARETADYLKRNAAGERVMALMYETVAMLPYLPPHPFVNQPTPYWMYSVNFNYAERMPAELAKHPDVVVAGAQYVREETPANQIFVDVPPQTVYWSIDPRYMAQVGYKEATRFCGDIFMRGGTATEYCNIIYRPDAH
jgi:hypothetical protein